MVRFTKMEAYGNDYIYIDAINNRLDNLKELAKKLTNRHWGIGGDGLVLICASDKADFKMRIFNPDGTEAEMCGNALRSVGKYVYVNNLTQKKEFKIETIGGIKNISLDVKNGDVLNITAMIGSPIFDPKLMVDTKKEKFFLEPLKILDKTFLGSTISLGNPHSVIFLDEDIDLQSFDIAKYGPLIENNPIFKNRTNVTFAKVIREDKLAIREWERGTGETLGCATGSCAAVVVGYILGFNKENCVVKQIGGDINIKYNPNVNELTMIGPSNIVFEGNFDMAKFIKEDK